MMKIVISDLDSTLADTRHRAPLAHTGPSSSHEDWIDYSKACIADPPIKGSIAALKLLSKLYPIYLVSGRNVEAEAETIFWLEMNDVPWTSLRMRSTNDIQHNGEYKVAYLQMLRKQGHDPVLMLEDHVGVAEMVEAIGVPVLSVNPRYEDTVGVRFNNLTPPPLTFDQIVQGDGTPPRSGSPLRHFRR